VALDPDTGTLKWYFQEVPHDVWDFDAAYESVLLDLEKDGQMQKLLLHTNKNGFVYILDRTNGKFITAWPLTKTFNWAKGIDEQGKPIDPKSILPGAPTIICPGLGGRRDWNQGAYSPRTKLYYTTGVEYCAQVTVKREKPVQGKPYLNADIKYVPAEDSNSHLDAYDPLTGRARWTYRTRYPLLSSILATGGDLIFTGDIEGYFLAFDAETGEKLWSFNTGSGHRGSSISYSVNGKQYIAVPSGYGSLQAEHIPEIWPEAKDFRSGATLFVFALSGE
jgi:alcohol dehydrogenase (cytochrome c)